MAFKSCIKAHSAYGVFSQICLRGEQFKKKQTQQDNVPYIVNVQGTRRPQVPFLWGKGIQILEFYATSHSLAIFQKDTFSL